MVSQCGISLKRSACFTMSLRPQHRDLLQFARCAAFSPSPVLVFPFLTRRIRPMAPTLAWLLVLLQALQTVQSLYMMCVSVEAPPVASP